MAQEELLSRLNQIVRLEFSDGEVVEAILLGLNLERDHDLTYEVVKILRPASPVARGTAVGTTCVARLNELVSWSDTADRP